MSMLTSSLLTWLALYGPFPSISPVLVLPFSTLKLLFLWSSSLPNKQPMHNYFLPFIPVWLHPYPNLVFILSPGQSQPYISARCWPFKNLLPKRSQYSSSGICRALQEIHHNFLWNAAICHRVVCSFCQLLALSPVTRSNFLCRIQ